MSDRHANDPDEFREEDAKWAKAKNDLRSLGGFAPPGIVVGAAPSWDTALNRVLIDRLAESLGIEGHGEQRYLALSLYLARRLIPPPKRAGAKRKWTDNVLAALVVDYEVTSRSPEFVDEPQVGVMGYLESVFPWNEFGAGARSESGRRGSTNLKPGNTLEARLISARKNPRAMAIASALLRAGRDEPALALGVARYMVHRELQRTAESLS